MRFLFCFVLALLLGGSYTASADVLYSVTDLGTLGGSASEADAINDAGQIVGASLTSSGATHAFLYTNGRMTDLGTLGGGTSVGVAVNNAGQVAGDSITGSGAVQAFLYSGGQMTGLGTPSLTNTYGRGINDKGQVVGIGVTSSYGTSAYLFANGGSTNLGTLGGSASYAYGINNAGQIVGSSLFSPGSETEHAFLYSNGRMMDLAPVGSSYSQATAISNAGQITGFAQLNGGLSHAFLYSNGTMTDLGSLPGFLYSWGEGVNDSGQVVGYLSGNIDYLTHDAFVDSSGVMVDLNGVIDPSLQIRLAGAAGINDVGQIVADGSNGHAYLLTPVPEPRLLALSGLGLLGLGAWVRRVRVPMSS